MDIKSILPTTPNSTFAPQNNATTNNSNAGASTPGNAASLDFSGGSENTAGAFKEKSATSMPSNDDAGASVTNALQQLSQLLQQLMQLLQPQSGSTDTAEEPSVSAGNSAPSGTSTPPSAPDQAAPSSSKAAAPDNAVPDQNNANEMPSGEATNKSSDSSSTGKLHLPEGVNKDLAPMLQKAGDASGIDPAVLAGMGYQENRLAMGPSTVNGGNGASDVGMMQVNQETFQQLKKDHPDQLGANASLSNTQDNIMAGALYMKDMKEKFGSTETALRAYNSGPENVNPNDLSDISKTGTGDSTYVDKVTGFADTIRSGKGELPG